ncbi:hypothetical protein SAMN05444581_11231 [Methylocapsa palsarum]|uniref:Clp protease n=2 Tax=Methylocapsa palsarum TaxID=1612308 RepID=A0A1I4AXS9_9HYPH|nr:hypothetical protein SAMN05444581_11231 [Methylocapsa palsarum]
MNFRIVPASGSFGCLFGCGPAIEADGEITDSTPDEFSAFMRANAATRRARPIVFIDSQGGKIAAGMALGRLFRKAGVTTIVARAAPGAFELNPATCYSACVYALMGGAIRIALYQSRIAIHRMFAYDGGSRRFDNGKMASWVKRYASLMGVSPDLVAAAENGTDAIQMLSPIEIVKWRLARIEDSAR